jgi:uncharacterized protein (TIGR02453 family)
MATAFRGFPAEGIAFLRALARNNRREWFQPRKDDYETLVKAPMTVFVEALNGVLAEAAPDYVTDPARAIFRIYRDTRFSRDKKPYKTHVAASFWKRGLPKHNSAGFYVGVAAEEVHVGGGAYMPGSAEVRTIRHHLAASHERLRAILEARDVARLLGGLHGEPSSRMPKGFPAGHPAGDLLRRKQWFVFVTLDGGIATTPKLFDQVAKRFRAAAPLIEEINRAFAGSKKSDPLMIR